MTLVIILNVVLAIAVAAAVLRLLGGAIASSPPDQARPDKVRDTVPHPRSPRRRERHRPDSAAPTSPA